MKNLLPFLAFFLLNPDLFAQTDHYKEAIGLFQSRYNEEKYEDIFKSFSTEMQKAMPDPRAFLNSLKTQIGQIKETKFMSYTQGTYATYKATFERALVSLNLSLNNQNQINGLFIKPYEEPSENGERIVNALNSYPSEIAQAIYLEARDFPDNTQLAIAVIQDGSIRYYGVILQNDSLKVIKNENKVFEIGSVTKVFTATVLASLTEEKKITLTDNINTFYPFAFKNNQKITFQDLANHTSGHPRLPPNLPVANENNPYKSYGKAEIESYLKELLSLKTEAPKTYAYSNLGAGLLGYTLGLSAQTTFQDLLQKRVFDKYGMKNSYMTSKGLDEQLVKGRDPKGASAPNWDFDVLFGAGGVLSTAEDLARFSMAQFSPQNAEIALTQAPTFTVNQNMKTGLGWHIVKFTQGKELLWHNGGTAGYSSSLHIDPAGKTAVIVLSNASAFHSRNKNIDDLGLELMKLMNK